MMMMVVHRLVSWENVNNWSCYCCRCCIDRTLLNGLVVDELVFV